MEKAATTLTASKLPQVTLVFWVMKIAATTLGETGGDLLAQTLNVGYAISTLILLSVFVVTLVVQLRARKFSPALYWTVIVSTSTAGTTISDYMDRTLRLGYFKGTLILISLLTTALVFWKVRFGSISISRVQGFELELMYWTTILCSNTLGTALGDYLSDSSGLGFGGGALLIASLIAVIAVLHFRTEINKVVLFWAAFVLTRPLGATVGDLFTKPHSKGGLGFGTYGATAVLVAVLVGLIIKTNSTSGVAPAASSRRARHRMARRLPSSDPAAMRTATAASPIVEEPVAGDIGTLLLAADESAARIRSEAKAMAERICSEAAAFADNLRTGAGRVVDARRLQAEAEAAASRRRESEADIATIRRAAIAEAAELRALAERESMEIIAAAKAEAAERMAQAERHVEELKAAEAALADRLQQAALLWQATLEKLRPTLPPAFQGRAGIQDIRMEVDLALIDERLPERQPTPSEPVAGNGAR